MPLRIASAPPSRCSGPVVSNKVRGPSASEQRRAIARRHSALPASAAALKFAGSAGSLAGSFGGSSHPKRTAITGSSEAREASPGSLAVARAALGLGATIALAPRQPSATSECEADSSPSSSGPRISASGGASDGPRRPVGQHEKPHGRRSRGQRGGRRLAPADGDLGRDELVGRQRPYGRSEQRGRLGTAVRRRGEHQQLRVAEQPTPFEQRELVRACADGGADGSQPARQSGDASSRRRRSPASEPSCGGPSPRARGSARRRPAAKRRRPEGRPHRQSAENPGRALWISLGRATAIRSRRARLLPRGTHSPRGTS